MHKMVTLRTTNVSPRLVQKKMLNRTHAQHK